MTVFFDGPKRGSLPAEFTHLDLLSAGLSEDDAEQVLAFREFLRAAGPIPSKEDRDLGAKIQVPEPWYSYGLGDLTAGEALAAAAGEEPGE